MICVEVKPYCDQCMEFEPDVKKPDRMYVGDGTVIQTDTIVRCAHRRRCQTLEQYFMKREKERADLEKEN